MKLKSLLNEGIDMESYHIAPFRKSIGEIGPSEEGLELLKGAIKPGTESNIIVKIAAYYFYHKGRKDGFEYIKHYYDKGEFDEVKNDNR